MGFFVNVNKGLFIIVESFFSKLDSEKKERLIPKRQVFEGGTTLI